MAGTTVTLYVS